MTAKEYIDRFRMDQENYEFNRQEFINQLRIDFLESIHRHENYDNKVDTLEYKYFREIVKEFQDKFDKISRLKKVGNLSPGLWKAFFASVIVPYRKEKYPIMQKAIEYLKQKDKSYINKTGQNG